METIHIDFDELTAMASEQFSSGPELNPLTPRTMSSGLEQNPSSSTPYVPPTKKDWDIMFQPMFNEYFNPPSSVVSHGLLAVAAYVSNTTSTPLSTSSTTHETHSPILSQVEPKNYKEALLKSLWIEAMQEEINEFEHVNDRKMSFFFGLKISQSPKGIFINQSKYALEIIKKYGMESSELVDTPMVDRTKLDEDLQGTPADPTRYRGMIGSLMYLTSSRPDLVSAACMCARIALTAFADADHSGCQDTRRSTSSSAQFLGDRLVSWSSKKQKSTTISSIEHSRSKHIDIRYHFIKEQVENGVVELYFVRTEYQLTDIFTKALARERFEFLINRLGMKSMSQETLKSLAEEEE
ncbi:hypothetical protein Tco_0513903 [Tanacetum coccineum]